jgi:hypothetical protein
MNGVQEKIDHELWQDAASYIIQKGKYVDISTLQKEERQEDDSDDEDHRVIYALILNIKKPKENTKKVQYQRNGKVLTTYSRLLLLR